MRRTMSSSSPRGAESCSTSVTKPYLYSRFASSSIVCVEVLTMLSRCLYAERHTAAAGALRVRVVEDEPLTEQARVVVEDSAFEQPEALGIDEHLRAHRALTDDVRVLGRLLPAEDVLEPRAAARLHADPETGRAKGALDQHLLDLVRRVLRDLNHRFIVLRPNPSCLTLLGALSAAAHFRRRAPFLKG